jgi:serine/threonine protein phosphatase PrpC
MTAVACASCGATGDTGARYCEACGAELPGGPPTDNDQAQGPRDHAQEVADHARDDDDHARDEDQEGREQLTPPPAAAPCACGGSFADDGYCENCGAPAPRARDHVVVTPASWVVGVCDRGIRHRRNEDALALAATGSSIGDGRAALVVCDGVSSAPDSDVASMAAAQAARDVLARRLDDDEHPATPEQLAVLLQQAVSAANAAVVASTPDSGAANPPSCTFVGGVVEPDLLVVASVGDSRAYWLPDVGEDGLERARLLTRDDSLASEAIDAGVPAADAERMRGAHTITKWLGVDAPALAPSLVATRLDGPGWVLLCSDGLWNYCSPAADLAALVRTAAGRSDDGSLGLAEALVAWANAQGGADNITVALARVDPALAQIDLAPARIDPASALE